MSTKLHELLAVEPDRSAAAKAILDETASVFSKKPDHFFGTNKVYEPFNEADNDAESETKELVTTVPDKLAHLFKVVGRELDVIASKDATNQKAMAEVVVDGKPILPPLPATTLLSLESKLKTWIGLFLQIPTLPPGREWVKSTSRGAHVYEDSQPDIKYRTKKVPMSKVLYEATKEHPAQIERWAEDVKVGKITERKWVGMLSPADKSDLIARAQELLAAVKQARQRANTQEVETRAIGEAIARHLLG